MKAILSNSMYFLLARDFFEVFLSTLTCIGQLSYKSRYQTLEEPVIFAIYASCSNSPIALYLMLSACSLCVHLPLPVRLVLQPFLSLCSVFMLAAASCQCSA